MIKILGKHDTMNMFNIFRKQALFLGCLLMLFSFGAKADEIQDINGLLKQGKTDEALERVNAYLASKPKDAAGRFQKGLILTEQGKTNDAIRIFTALTQDYPELPEPYNNLAVLYANQGQYDKARTELELAIHTHPSYATAHENLGDIYAKMASQAYDRALQLDSGNTNTQTKLALIQDLFSGSSSKGERPARTQQAEQIAVATPPKKAVAAPEKPVATEKPAATEAAPSTPRRDASDSDSNSEKVVLKTVHRWIAAWSARNVPEYLSFYADNFVVPDGMTRAAWESQRRERISKPASIKIELSNIHILVDGDQATVSFRQAYRASHFKTNSNKMLLLVKSGGNWLIQEERTGK